MCSVFSILASYLCQKTYKINHFSQLGLSPFFIHLAILPNRKTNEQTYSVIHRTGLPQRNVSLRSAVGNPTAGQLCQ